MVCFAVVVFTWIWGMHCAKSYTPRLRNPRLANVLRPWERTTEKTVVNLGAWARAEESIDRKLHKVQIALSLEPQPCQKTIKRRQPINDMDQNASRLFILTKESDDDDTFNSSFSGSVSIYLNHERISRDDFQSNMKNSLSALSLPSTNDWKEVLEIPTKSEEG